MDKLKTLRQFSHFDAIPLHRLATLAEYAMRREIPEGDRLWRQSDEPINFTFVVSGHIKIVKRLRDGNETILGLFHPGESVGHVAVMHAMPYPASAVALTDVVTLGIARTQLTALMQEYPAFSQAMTADVARRAANLVERIDELSLGAAEQRLAAIMLKLADNPHLAGAAGEPLQIRISLSRGEIAQLINVTVETAIRIMSRWSKEGWVLTEPDRFVILAPDALATIADQVR